MLERTCVGEKSIHLRPIALHEVTETGKYGGMMDGVTVHFIVQRVAFVGVLEGLFAVLSGQQWGGSSRQPGGAVSHTL